MKFDSQQAFPYPVLRSNSNDYIGEVFSIKTNVRVTNEIVEIDVEFALSCSEIIDLIDSDYATYVVLITSKETFEQQFFYTKENKSTFKVSTKYLRGRISLESYVVATNRIGSFESSSINNEYGDGPFSFEIGEILAQNNPSDFYISREYFKPLQSIVKINLNDQLKNGEWEIKLEQSHIVVDASKSIHSLYSDAKNSANGKDIMLNSIWFSVITHAIDRLKDSSDVYSDYVWAEVLIAKVKGLGMNIDSHDSYKMATMLLNDPLLRLRGSFEGGFK